MVAQGASSGARHRWGHPPAAASPHFRLEVSDDAEVPQRLIPPTGAGIATAALEALPRCGAVRLVCVDGPAGSGKTTLAAGIEAELSLTGAACTVVHLDDLY